MKYIPLLLILGPILIAQDLSRDWLIGDWGAAQENHLGDLELKQSGGRGYVPESIRLKQDSTFQWGFGFACYSLGYRVGKWSLAEDRILLTYNLDSCHGPPYEHEPIRANEVFYIRRSSGDELIFAKEAENGRLYNYMFLKTTKPEAIEN